MFRHQDAIFRDFINKIYVKSNTHTMCKYFVHSEIIPVNILAPVLFFFILAHPVYNIWIIQEPNTLELWNKLHFGEKKTEIIYHV